MKILVIHNSYAKYSGEEAVVHSQVELLEQHGHDVLYYGRHSGELGERWWGKYMAFFTGLYNPISNRRVRKIIQQSKPDIVHVHNLFPSVSPSILPVISRMGLPIVMTVHNYRLICPNGLFYTKNQVCEKCSHRGKEWNCILNNCEKSRMKSAGYALRNLWSRKRGYYRENVDRYLCLTEFQRQKLAQNGFEAAKLEVLPNYIRTQGEIGQHTYQPGQRKYIVFAGRINKQKGFDFLAETMWLLKDVPLKAAGDKADGSINLDQLPENIQIMGKLKKEQMDGLYSGAKFLVFTSASYEGFPMVLLEAFQHGLPIIAPKLGPNPDIVSDGVNGMLYEPGDKHSLAEAIDKLWQNEDQCRNMSQNNLAESAKYSPESYYQGHLKVYQSLLQDKTS